MNWNPEINSNFNGKCPISFGFVCSGLKLSFKKNLDLLRRTLGTSKIQIYNFGRIADFHPINVWRQADKKSSYRNSAGGRRWDAKISQEFDYYFEMLLEIRYHTQALCMFLFEFLFIFTLITTMKMPLLRTILKFWNVFFHRSFWRIPYSHLTIQQRKNFSKKYHHQKWAFDFRSKYFFVVVLNFTISNIITRCAHSHFFWFCWGDVGFN